MLGSRFLPASVVQGGLHAVDLIGRPTLSPEDTDELKSALNAELFALQPEIEAADRRYEASHAPCDEAEAAFNSIKPPKPEPHFEVLRELLVEWKKKLGAEDALDPAPRVRSRWAEFRDDFSDRVERKGYFKNRMTPSELDRAVDAIPHKVAMEQWEAECKRLRGECKRLRGECGLTAANAEQNAAVDAILDVRDKVEAIPATTLAGLIFKAKFAAAHFGGEPDEFVTASIVDDLITLGEGTANV